MHKLNLKNVQPHHEINNATDIHQVRINVLKSNKINWLINSFIKVFKHGRTAAHI